MPFPSPALAAPSLANYQMQFGGLKFAGIDRTTAYQMVSLTGIDAVDTDSGDSQRAQDPGEFVGLDVLKGRDITLQQVVKSITGQTLDVARQAMAGAFLAGGATEQPLYIKLPSGLFACMARARRHNFPLDISMVMAGGGTVTTLWHATDPRWYAIPTKTATVGLPAPLGGLSFPVTFPASFGGGGVGGILQVTNAGLMEMRPIIVFTGPCTNPVATNLSIAGAPYVGFTIALAAGDTLVVDTDFQSAVYYASGSTIGTSRRNALTSGSTWFNLPRGLNQIEFNSSDGTQVAGTMTVQSADAYPGL